MARTTFLRPGEPAPWFSARSTRNEQFKFDTAGGRYIVLCFFGSSSSPASRQVLEDFEQYRANFTEEIVFFCGVSTDPADEQRDLVPRPGPGIMYFWDFDRRISRLYGAVNAAVDGVSEECDRPCSVVLDLNLRTLAVFPFDDAPETHVPRLLQLLGTLPSPASVEGHAPILVVPRVFEPELCRELIQMFEQNESYDSGFMLEKDGRTVGKLDHSFKRRRDYELTDEQVLQATVVRIHDRLVPEIDKAFGFHATRIERYLVCCYEATTSDHFHPHRDNTTTGTAHRRFAVSIFLNPDEYEGGDVRFPEFGSKTYRAELGGAVVFSCSLLHEVVPMIRGRRFAFLPFLYDDAAAELRDANLKFLDE
jgi:peroxiredoxin/predicted 2-oxoglutarate/Fe(II)-dependent dioxygenase YbiX